MLAARLPGNSTSTTPGPVNRGIALRSRRFTEGRVAGPWRRDRTLAACWGEGSGAVMANRC